MQIKSGPRFWGGFKRWTALFVVSQYADLVLTLGGLNVLPFGFSEANPIALIRISTGVGYAGKVLLPPLILLAVWKMRGWKAYRLFLYLYTLLLMANDIYIFALLAPYLL